MLRMSERTIVYNRKGVPLAELSVQMVRGWKLERTNSAEGGAFEIDASATTKELLDYGNFVAVWSDDLPAWAGVIVPPRIWSVDGRTMVSLKSCEHLLSFRVTGTNDEIEGTGGRIFAYLLNAIVSRRGGESLPLVVLDETKIVHVGREVRKIYHRENVFDIVNALADEVDQFWARRRILN